MFWAIIVLPRPCGATRTTLRAAARNSSWRTASTVSRSMCLGQGPVEVSHRAEPAEMAAVDASLEAAFRALGLLGLGDVLEELGGPPTMLGRERHEVVEIRRGVTKADERQRVRECALGGHGSDPSRGGLA
jgi:hypothetical protein